MDEDDDFGDLYTNVLSTFPSSVSNEQSPPSAAPPLTSHLFDLGGKDDHQEVVCEDPDSGFTSSSNYANQTLVVGVPTPPKGKEVGSPGLDSDTRDKSFIGEVGKNDDLSVVFANWAPDSPKGTASMVFEGVVKKETVALEDGDIGDKPCIGVVKEEGDEEEGVSDEKDDGFDVQVADTKIGDRGLESNIPGLLIQGDTDVVEDGLDAKFPLRDVAAEVDAWDSDSEDDLNIVLDDVKDGVSVANDGNDDVADVDPNLQQIDEQDWSQDAAPSDAERKDVGEAGKLNGKAATAPKIGYSGHGYHPFHSQFKYVRPGATVIPSTGPAGGIIPVRPLVTSSGRGRGDWRPTVNKVAPAVTEKLHPGYGMPWGNNLQGRNGGVEFTLPSFKSIFDVDIDGFDEKQWKLPGVDLSDFFNFGLNEDSWKDYSKQLEQIRLEATMQSKIRVYESGRTQHEYDPDLPPELAAASNIHDDTAETSNTEKQDAVQGDLANGSLPVRPPLPNGRPIPVEISYGGERLPSIDTRPPRIRDSDAIIEVILQDLEDDDPSAGNDFSEQPTCDSGRKDFSAVQNAHSNSDYCDDSLLACNSNKREIFRDRAPFANTIHGNDQLKENGDKPSQYRLRDLEMSNEERQINRRQDGSPPRSLSPNSQIESYPDSENEDSVGAICGRHRRLLSSLVTTIGEQRHGHKFSEPDESILGDGNTQLEGVGMKINTVDAVDILKSDDSLHHDRKQLLSSLTDHPLLQQSDDVGDAKLTSSENSKAKVEGNKDYQRKLVGNGENVTGDRHSARVGRIKRQCVGDESIFRRNDRSLKQEGERHQTETIKGRGESYSKLTHPHSKTTGVEDVMKRESRSEIGSRQKGKLREWGKSDTEHVYSRKPVDNVSWGEHREKELGSRSKGGDDGSKKNHHDNLGHIYSKKTRNEKPVRDSADKQEVLHGNRESTNHRNRERDEIPDQRKKDDQGKVRENSVDHLSVRHKDEGCFQREGSGRQRERGEMN